MVVAEGGSIVLLASVFNHGPPFNGWQNGDIEHTVKLFGDHWNHAIKFQFNEK